MESKINCLLCDSKNYIRLLTIDKGLPNVEKIHIVRCNDCGLVYMNPQPDIDYLMKRYGEEYYKIPAFSQMSKPFVKSKGIRKFIENLYVKNEMDYLKTLNKHSKVLDIGCGGGKLLYDLKKEGGCQVFGCDISDYAIKHAKKVFDLNLFNGTIQQTKFQSNFFDTIIMWNYIEHDKKPLEALRIVHRLLKNGGLLLIEVPNYNSLNRAVFGKYWFGFCPEHLSHFTPKTITKLLEKAGFKVKLIEHSALPGGIITSFCNMITHDKKELPRQNLLYKILWFSLVPLTVIQAKLHRSDLMIIVAVK